MFAVIKTGGKQYVVKKGDVLQVERIPGMPEGGKISFEEVLLRADGEKLDIGSPTVKGAVEGKLVKEVRGKKKIVFRYHSKTRYRKLKGHRQTYAMVEITKV
jgi:large subunit ribosomal protein L21